jgi:CRISPR-associated protein Csx3
MSAYKIETETATTTTATLFRVSFGSPAQNDEIVRAAAAALESLGELGGKLALINGPASLPVACVLAHHLGHRFGAVAVFDPKMGAYVVAVSHNPEYPLGSLIPA